MSEFKGADCTFLSTTEASGFFIALVEGNWIQA